MMKPRKRQPGQGAKRRDALVPTPRPQSKLSDEQLLAKLQARGVELDRAKLKSLCEQYLSTEQIAQHLLGPRPINDGPISQGLDPVRACLLELWQRWCPEIPGFEMLDERIEAGYSLLDHDVVAACDAWWVAWQQFVALFDKTAAPSLDAFDTQLHGSFWITHWLELFEHELWNAGVDQPRFFRIRVRVCKENLRRFATDRPSAIENRRCSLAESHFELGDTAQTDALFRQWLDADPQWGYGWIRWANCYQFAQPQSKDLKRTEQILLQGRSVAGLRDADHLTEHLAAVYEEQGRTEEARTLLAQLKPQREAKVGRNDPCPCGSGKKFKKCHGSAAS